MYEVRCQFVSGAVTSLTMTAEELAKTLTREKWIIYETLGTRYTICSDNVEMLTVRELTSDNDTPA